ncbi:hypothetical protein L1887_31996 [Cichorium endivia]|nr:hypothetical protein L1887_31996 [Cichorium endivia]
MVLLKDVIAPYGKQLELCSTLQTCPCTSGPKPFLLHASLRTDHTSTRDFILHLTKVMNKRTCKIEETFNLSFDDYYIKKSQHPFPMSSIFPKPAVDALPIMNFDTDFKLLFDPPLTDGPEDSPTSSVQRPSSVEGEPSNRSSGKSGFEGEHNNPSLNHPSHETSHIMFLYPSVQGEPEVSTPISSDNGGTNSPTTAVEGEHTLNSSSTSSNNNTPKTNVTKSDNENHLINDDFPSTSGYPSDTEEINAEGPSEFDPNFPP